MGTSSAWTMVAIAVLLPACSSHSAVGFGVGGSESVGFGVATSAGTSATSSGGVDTFGPWAGGATYYGKFANGPPSDPSFFPITVWLQSPSSAAAYKAIGINTFVGLYQGPTESDLSDLASAGMPVACDQNDVGLKHLDDPTIVAWTQQDEPDNAQALTGGGYGPCVPASTVDDLYTTMHAADPSRPVFLNLGQGVAHDYIGWGSECAMTHPGDYPLYLEGADIVSFDIYPMNETDADVHGHIELVGHGVDNLVTWTHGQKPVWNWIECTGISDPGGKPTPEQVKAEVWLSIIHGSMGIGYFAHQIMPTFDEHALLDDATMKAAVSAINAQVTELAPVLNTPPILSAGVVSSSDASVPIDMMVKRSNGATYVFAVAKGPSPAKATFRQLTNLPPAAPIQVVGENRQLALEGASFEDDFDGYAVHIYRIE